MNACTAAMDPGLDAPTLPIADGVAAAVRLDGDWLCFQLRLPAARPATEDATAWDLLAWHASARGGAKFALSAGGEMVARAELPLDDGDAADGIDEVRAGLADLVQRWRSRAPGPAAAHSPPAAVAADVGALCRGCDWPAREVGDGRWLCELDTRDASAQATVERLGSGVRVACDLPPVDAEIDPLCRRALADFLLRAAAMLRLARPLAGDARGVGRAMRAETVLGFEVTLDTGCTPARLGHALSALTLAYRLCSREAAVLARDAATARAYLRLAAEPAAAAPRSIDRQKGGTS